MQHTSRRAAPCQIARSLERVGAWWNIMILRDAFLGLTRFVWGKQHFAPESPQSMDGCPAWTGESGVAGIRSQS